MKKFFLIVIPALVLTVLLVWGIQLLLQYRTQKGPLQVTSAPESKVYLNDTYIGKTPLCKCEASDMLQAGNYTIRLVPTDNTLSEFQEKITISEAVLTVVDRKFAKGSFSEGYVLSLTRLPDKKKTELLVVSIPEKATILLDDATIGETPFLFKDPTDSDHILKVRKNGYQEKTLRIHTPLGYKLTVAVYLGTNPDDLSSLPASSSATTSITPSPTLSGATVTILETPTGFLRVRGTIGGAEIGKVNPGETYQLLDDKNGWLQIKLTDGQSGWISSEYAKKQ